MVYSFLRLSLSMYSYKWMIPFTYTTDANTRWTNPDFLWMQKSDGKSKSLVNFIFLRSLHTCCYLDYFGLSGCKESIVNHYALKLVRIFKICRDRWCSFRVLKLRCHDFSVLSDWSPKQTTSCTLHNSVKRAVCRQFSYGGPCVLLPVLLPVLLNLVFW